mmetsp:Transcript_19119/g.44713  ORF Transcript_19119/g.44713 Transcript_19119/m.44713 type:complete len:437 (+) Transcript_19119:139-1449(+)
MEGGPLAAVAALWGKEDPLSGLSSWRRSLDEDDSNKAQDVSHGHPAAAAVEERIEPQALRPASEDRFFVEPVFDRPFRVFAVKAPAIEVPPAPRPRALRVDVEWVPSNFDADDAMLAQGGDGSRDLGSWARPDAPPRQEAPLAAAGDRQEAAHTQQGPAWDGQQPIDIPLEEQQRRHVRLPPGPPRDLGGRQTLHQNPDEYVQDLLSMRHLPMQPEEEAQQQEGLAPGRAGPPPAGDPSLQVLLPFTPITEEQALPPKPEEPAWVLSSPDVAQDMRRGNVYLKDALSDAKWDDAVDVKAQRAFAEARAKMEWEMAQARWEMERRGDARQPVHGRVYYEYGEASDEGGGGDLASASAILGPASGAPYHHPGMQCPAAMPQHHHAAMAAPGQLPCDRQLPAVAANMPWQEAPHLEAMRRHEGQPMHPMLHPAQHGARF